MELVIKELLTVTSVTLFFRPSDHTIIKKKKNSMSSDKKTSSNFIVFELKEILE